MREGKIITGDSLEVLESLESETVQCVVTSPPYWGLRDYGIAGQLGLEPSPYRYLENMVQLFREVRRVLRKDGIAWVNMGDSYVSTGGAREHGWQPETNGRGEVNSYPKRDGETIMPLLRNRHRKDCDPKRAQSSQSAVFRGVTAVGELKPKDLVGMPWMLAFALRADGWYLRQDVIWAKPNPMPESVRDRCTKSHEYLFLLSKSERYFYDADAIAEPVTAPEYSTDDDIARALSRRRETSPEARQGPAPARPLQGQPAGPQGRAWSRAPKPE